MQTVLARPIAPSARPAPGLRWAPLRVTADGSLLIGCEIDGRAVTGMIDTGAAVSIVDTRHAPPGRAVGSLSVGADWGMRTLVALSALKLVIAGETLVAGRPAAADLSGLEEVVGEPVDLIVGQDILGQRPCVMEFGARRLALPAAEPIMSARWRRAALTRGAGGRLLIEARLDGGAPTPAVFDLGSNNPVMVDLNFAETRGLLCDRPTSTAATNTLLGPQIARTFTLASVALGGLCLQGPPADAFAVWSDTAAPVNLGFPIFRRFDLMLDIRGAALWLAPSPEAGAAFARDRSGLGLAFRGDRLRVMHVARNSPAAFAGWREAEEITVVDGRAVDRAFMASGCATWRTRPAGTSVALEGPFGVRRLVLADYC